MEPPKIIIREMTEADAPIISAAFAAQGWTKPVSLYTGYAQDSHAGRRTNLLAESGGQFAGYVTIVWESDYPPFHKAGIPEIVDFNVLLKFRRMGVGSALMDEAERRIDRKSVV